jgi:hypothetical protein
MQDKLVKIKNIQKMARHIRRDVAKHHEIPLKELKDLITQNEVVSLIKQYSQSDDLGNLLINCEMLDKVFKEVYTWMVGIEISRLASAGTFDVYWNSDKASMTFSATTEKENGING